MNKEKLTVKDLINIGIFTALYIAIIFIAASVVFLPILQLLMPATAALLLAPVYLLFVAKTQKCFCITILGLIVSLVIGLVMFGNVVCFAVNFVCFVLAEIVASRGAYKNFKINAISYIVAAYFPMGEIAAYWFAKDYMYNISMRSGYTRESVDLIMAIATPLNFAIVLICITLTATISVFLARRMFKKHFIRVGIA